MHRPGGEATAVDMLVLTVSPGKLGLTLSILANGNGAEVRSVDPACTFKGKIDVGDRIVSIDGRRIEKIEDLTVGKDRVRKFGVAKAATANPEAAKKIKAGKVVAKKRSNAVVSKELPSKLEVPPGESEKEKAVETSSSPTAEMNNNTAFLPESAAAMAPEYIPPLNRKPAFPNLTKMNANRTDRVSGYRREEIMTELLQWDKKNSVNVSLCERERE